MIRRVVVPLLVAGALAVMAAGPVGAHVTVSSDDAEPGSFAVITFRVPNEEADADTVGLKIQLPPDHPIAFVSTQPKPGWDVDVKTETLDETIEAHGDQITEAVTEISWTGGQIPPGAFDQFRIQAGPLPEGVDTLTFKAIQTYEDDDGETTEVAWIQETGADGVEPDHPAPVLELTAGSADAVDSAVGTGEGSVDDGDGGSNTTFVVFAMAFGAAGLVIGVLALVLAVASRHKVGMIAREVGIGEDD